jgi:glycosyltransferase involved in cell wall biosynthesis
MVLILRFAKALIRRVGAALSRTNSQPNVGLTRSAVSPTDAMSSQYRGDVRYSFDSFFDGMIRGWIWDPATPDQFVTVQLRCGVELILTRPANLYRSDLEAEGMNGGRAAFEILVPTSVLERARTGGEILTLAPLERSDIPICAIDVREALGGTPRLRALLRDMLIQNKKNMPVFARDKREFDSTSRRRPGYSALFDWPASEKAPAENLMIRRLSPYCDYVRHFAQAERQFSTEISVADFDHFLRWYLDDFGVSRKPARVPLSADLLRYLNEPVAIGGRLFPLTRILLWNLLDKENIFLLSNFDDEVGYRNLLYWWVAEKATALNIEDCAITYQQIEFMRNALSIWSREVFPLSRFAQAALSHRQPLAELGSVFDVSTRVTAYFFLLLEAINEPGILRFVPDGVLRRFFDQEGSFFNKLVGETIPDVPLSERLDAQSYELLIAQKSFDIASLQYKSIDSRGHRLEAAQLPRPCKDLIHDVQVIGPFSKISGLARICQISREALQETDLDCVFTDFIMNNPQPDDAKAMTANGCSLARVNIVHLNADMLPDAFAYLPDIFSEAYNIGFFFWELNEPATCHQLALDLVDEIWVSSEYNRRCFSAHTHKPVVNIGTAISNQARTFRSTPRGQRFKINQDDFVFFVAYDSLSYLQRKNPLGAIRAFLDAFPDDKTVRFVVKTHNANSLPEGAGAKSWEALIRLSQDDERISIWNETLPYEVFMDIVATFDCYVSLHRSEGFGLGMLEAMSLGVPVLCTAYSGNMDFCNDETAWLVDYDEVPLKFDDYAHVAAGHRWAEPRHASAVAAMRAVRLQNAERQKKISAARQLVNERFNLESLAGRYTHRLRTIMATLEPQPTP